MYETSKVPFLSCFLFATVSIGRETASSFPTRPIEAALVRAQRLAADEDADAAVATLRGLLDAAPPGFAGWTLPAEPFLRELHSSQAFAVVLSRLTERAR